MQELRQNIVTKEWVIIASERARRPHAFAEPAHHQLTSRHPPFDPDCPFCPGNEELDLEIERIPLHAENWQVRAVYNRYPALRKEATLSRTFKGVQRCISGVGHHELIVQHTRHNTSLGLMSPAEAHTVLTMLYQRGWAIQADGRIEHIIYFENHGERAGASLVHPHTQIIALPVVPQNIRNRIEEARRYFDDTGECATCVMLNDELRQNARVIVDSPHFAAFVLYAALSPMHVWIVPKRHGISYLFTTEEERADLARTICIILNRIAIRLNDPAYNLVFRTAPIKEMNSTYLHWYVTIVPRLSRMAGFEMGTGMFINPTLPEECAVFLRHPPD